MATLKHYYVKIVLLKIAFFVTIIFALNALVKVKFNNFVLLENYFLSMNNLLCISICEIGKDSFINNSKINVEINKLNNVFKHLYQIVYFAIIH